MKMAIWFCKKSKIDYNIFIQTQDETLLKSIVLFLDYPKHSVLYKHGQLFFIQEKNIISTKELDTQSDLIVSFDGSKMQRIDQGYYLGSSVIEARQYDMFGKMYIDIARTSSNNNNNNG